MPPDPRLEKAAAEAVSLLYLETLQRAKDAEEALQITRDERDGEYERNAQLIQKLSTSRSITKMQEAGIHERDKKIEGLEEQERELRKSLAASRDENGGLREAFNIAHFEHTRLRQRISKLKQQVDNVLA